MILIRGLMEEQLKRWDDLYRKKFYGACVSVYGSLLNLSIAVLGTEFDKEKEREINRIWVKIMKENINHNKTKIKASLFFRENFIIIVQAFNKIEDLIKQDSEVSAEQYKGIFLIQDYLYPAEDSLWC